MKWLLITLGILSNAAASILVKVAAQGRAGGGADLVSWLIDPLMILAVGSYGLAFIFYSLSLARLPLNVAHPVTAAGAIVLIGLSSVFLFREPVSAPIAAGYALLLCGIVLLSFGARGDAGAGRDGSA